MPAPTCDDLDVGHVELVDGVEVVRSTINPRLRGVVDCLEDDGQTVRLWVLDDGPKKLVRLLRRDVVGLTPDELVAYYETHFQPTWREKQEQANRAAECRALWDEEETLRRSGAGGRSLPFLKKFLGGVTDLGGSFVWHLPRSGGQFNRYREAAGTYEW